MFEAPMNDVISIDMDSQTIHFYTMPEGSQKADHLVANFQAANFDDAFYEKFEKTLKAYRQKHPASAMSKVSLVLPDHVFLTDTMDIPNIGKRAMENSLEVAIGTMYNKKDLLYHTFPLNQNKQFGTFGVVAVRKDLLDRLDEICDKYQMGLQNVTYAANAMVNGAFALNPKLKNGTFLLLDIKEHSSRFAFVNKGRTMGAYRLPFGYSMLHKTRLTPEDLLFDHASAELLVLNAQEKAKAKRLTMMEEEDMVEPEIGTAAPTPESREEEDVLAEEFEPTGKKSGRVLPKFMQRPTPADKEGFIYENFRIFVKWALELIANNPAITAQGSINTVYVNLPRSFGFVYDMVNEEAEENGVKFLPLITGGAGFGAATAGSKEMELFGGLYVKLYNKVNNF